jgi:hypothetical protein
MDSKSQHPGTDTPTSHTPKCNVDVPFAAPADEPESSAAPLEWTPFWVQIWAPSEACLGGVIAVGRFAIVDSEVRVGDLQGKLLGTHILKPSDDPEAVARKLLREKRPPAASMIPFGNR